MIIAIVNFPLGAGKPVDAVQREFEASAPRFQAIPGLLRKNYLYDPQSGVGGGAYLWQSRAAAEAYYSTEWSARMAAMFGQAPTVQHFESPVQVDNVARTIIGNAGG